VIGSAPLDLGQYYRRPDGSLPDYFAMRSDDLADPMRTVRSIRSNTEIFVIGDRHDRIVPAAAWETWVAAARRGACMSLPQKSLARIAPSSAAAWRPGT
jgi:hypothetical protein